jgi:F0F1-type ATP synthase membrane subunit b/b'
MFAAMPKIVVFGFLHIQEASSSWFDYPGFELWKFINLFVFIGVGLYILRRPLSDALRSRREAIKRDLLKAQEERDRALAQLAEVEARLERLDAEVAVIHERSQKEADAETQRINQATEAEMAQLRDQAKREIENAGKAAKHELRKFAAAQSVRLAEELIQGEIRPDDDVRLISRNLEEIGRSKP